MAGLTKEQRAERAAGKLAVAQAPQLVAMVSDFQTFPGAPTTADVHPDEVENWKAAGWRMEE
ncbi:hypothetical protein [Citrobacter youngae]|uniref:hypothetical protein n=1 Tax=Citrobacter youngae TaxID=133448 RepID=UPI00397C32E7